MWFASTAGGDHRDVDGRRPLKRHEPSAQDTRLQPRAAPFPCALGGVGFTHLGAPRSFFSGSWHHRLAATHPQIFVS